MTKKTYKLEDFFTKTICETSTKMPLMLDGKDTGHYFMVKGIDAKSVQRSRVQAQVGYADAAEEAEKIKDKVDRVEFERKSKEDIEVKLAADLIDDWSFGELDGKEKLIELLLENQGLSFAVIAHATTPSNYLAKK